MSPFTAYKMGAKKVLASITKPNENTSTMMPVRSLVYLPNKYTKHFNRILKTLSGKPLLLLADHHPTKFHIVYLGLHINAQVKVEAKYTGVHPVTNMPTTEFNSGTRTVSGVFELGSVSDERSLVVEKNVYILAEAVGPQDKLDGRTIKSIRELSGLYHIEVN
jgi:hypothetical protein